MFITVDAHKKWTPEYILHWKVKVDGYLGIFRYLIIKVRTKTLVTFGKHLLDFGMVTPRPDKPDKIVPDGARPKNGWFYLASCTRSLQETWNKLARLCQTTPKLPFVYKKRQNLVLSGQLVSSFLQTSGEPARTSHSLVWLRLGRFCLAGLVLV